MSNQYVDLKWVFKPADPDEDLDDHDEVISLMPDGKRGLPVCSNQQYYPWKVTGTDQKLISEAPEMLRLLIDTIGGDISPSDILARIQSVLDRLGIASQDAENLSNRQYSPGG